MRHRIFSHIAWTTRARIPIIDQELAEFLAELLPRIAAEERAELLALGVVRTHVHVLVRISPKTEIPRLLQRFKGTSAFLANRDRGKTLQWAAGYNIETVGAPDLARAWNYVANQHLRHPYEAIDGWPTDPADRGTIEDGVAEYLHRLDTMR